MGKYIINAKKDLVCIANAIVKYMRASSTITRNMEREFKYTRMAIFTWVNSPIIKNMEKAYFTGSVWPHATPKKISSCRPTRESGGEDSPTAKESIKKSMAIATPEYSKMDSNMEKESNTMEMVITTKGSMSMVCPKVSGSICGLTVTLTKVISSKDKGMVMECGK